VFEITPIEVLKRMVPFDTSNPPGNENALAAWIADLLSGVGFKTRLEPCGEGRASVVASCVKGRGKKVVLNGHLDVVKCGEGWSSNPFEPRVIGNLLYGRGAADMKGGVAAMICAGINVARDSAICAGELVLNFVADEELNNAGTNSCISSWKDADYIVIGEPTEMEIHIAHRGTVRFLINFHGKQCHSGTPQDGINAIEDAAAAIIALREYNKTLSKIKHQILPSPTSTVTMISGGTGDNIVPGKCSINVDRRMIPGDSGDSVESEIKRILNSVSVEGRDISYSMDRYICLEAGGVGRDDEIVQFAEVAHAECFGRKAVVRDFPATCEQAIITKENVPAIIYGPGSIKQAHIKDEFVEISQLADAVKFYETFARIIFKTTT